MSVLCYLRWVHKKGWSVYLILWFIWFSFPEYFIPPLGAFGFGKVVLNFYSVVQLSSVQSFSHVQLFATPWTAVCQASLSITNSQSLLKLMSIESVMPSNHLILCCALLLLPPILSSIRVFSNESTLHMRWPKYWNFSFNISPPN